MKWLHNKKYFSYISVKIQQTLFYCFIHSLKNIGKNYLCVLLDVDKEHFNIVKACTLDCHPSAKVRMHPRVFTPIYTVTT